MRGIYGRCPHVCGRAKYLCHHSGGHQQVGGTDIYLCSQGIPLMFSLDPDQGLSAVPWGQVSHVRCTGWHDWVGCTLPKDAWLRRVLCISSWVHVFIMTIFQQPPGAAADEGWRGWPFSKGTPSWPEGACPIPSQFQQGAQPYLGLSWAVSTQLMVFGG